MFPPMFVASTMASCFVSNAHSREQCFVVCPTSFGGKRYFLNVSAKLSGGEAYRGTLLYTDFVVAGFSSTSTSIGSAQRVFVLVHVQYLALVLVLWYLAWYGTRYAVEQEVCTGTGSARARYPYLVLN